MKINYLLLTFPKLTTTFVDREILALRQMGVDVKVYALVPPAGQLSEYQKDLVEETTYLFPGRLFGLLTAHLYFAITRPGRYFSLLAYLLTRPHPTLLSHRRTLLHFFQGIYTAYRMRAAHGDHVHAHFLNQSATIALIVHRMLGIPYSVTVHASGEFFATPMMVREKLVEAKFIATCTHYNQEHLAKIGKEVFDQKILMVYHGLDMENFRRRMPKPSGKPVILSVGQLRERKGLIYLVQACAILRDRGLDFVCRIVGEGPEREPLQSEIARAGLDGCVQLTGALPQEKVLEEYERANIFALPVVLAESGDRDGIPNVILEAMAMELPVVSTTQLAVTEIVHNNQNGMLVPPKDPTALADALQRLITNPSFADQMGAAGRTTVKEKFNPYKNAQQLLNAFLA